METHEEAIYKFALPCAVVSYSTCELVTRETVTPGAGTGWGGNCRMWCMCIYIYSFSALCVFYLHVYITRNGAQSGAYSQWCIQFVLFV